jgi:hypothetical protein
LGYFTEQDIVDLAGLISPEVIPIIRDQDQLAKYLDQQGVDYLVTFPSWYPDLVATAELVYQNDGVIAPKLEHENMAVYGWNPQGEP